MCPNIPLPNPAANPADAHVPLGQADLREIMCFEHERTVANNYEFRFECRLFQMNGNRGHFYWSLTF
jgi:hypothetical protein